MMLVRDFLGVLREQYTDSYFEIITLQKKNFTFCRGCGACKRSGDCVFKDDLTEVKQKVLKSDLLIMATPVYEYHVSAQMKAFFDRSFMWTGLMKLLGKPVITAVTAAGGGIKPTENYLKMMLLAMGAIVVGNMRLFTHSHECVVEKGKHKDTYAALAAKAAAILRGEQPKDTWLNQVYFSAVRRAILHDRAKHHGNNFDYEYTYWLAKGWLKSSYRQALTAAHAAPPARTAGPKPPPKTPVA